MSNPKARKGTPSKPTSINPYTTQSPAAAYKHFLPACKQVADDDVKVCTADVDVVRHNIDRAVGAVQPHIAVVHERLPLCPISEILELPALGLALTFACDRVAVAASTGEIAERLEALRPMRDLTLRQLEIFADLGLVPAERVRAIRAGNGPIDSARDAVAITAFFKEQSAKISGKHPFAPAYLKQLGAHGEWLLGQLKPEGALEAPSASNPDANLRDRLWTMISTRYDQLREAGVVVFGLRTLDDRVPMLGARAAKPAAAPEKPAADAPATPAAPAKPEKPAAAPKPTA